MEKFENLKKKGHDARSGMDAASYHNGWDFLGAKKQEGSKGKETRSTQRLTKSHLVSDLPKANEEKSLKVSLSVKPNMKKQEATSPLKPKINMKKQEATSPLKPKIINVNIKGGEVQAGPNKGKLRTGKGNLKKGG
nr:hypothetical protein CFP56_75729 [Quercus suber]